MNRRALLLSGFCVAACAARGGVLSVLAAEAPVVQPFALEGTSLPQQLAVDAADGTVWFAAANLGAIGQLDPKTGAVTYYALGNGARPRGLALGLDGHVYALDQQLNLIHDLDPKTGQVNRRVLPEDVPHLDLSMAATGTNGRIWFIGTVGWYGALDPATGEIRAWQAPGGRRLAALGAAPDGAVWVAASGASLVGRIEAGTGEVHWVQAPPGIAGLKSVAVDSQGLVWVTSYRGGQVARFDQARRSWMVFPLPSREARPAAVLATRDGRVYVTDLAGGALLAFHPKRREFRVVSQLSERGGAKFLAADDAGRSIWVAETAADRLVEVRGTERLMN